MQDFSFEKAMKYILLCASIFLIGILSWTSHPNSSSSSTAKILKKTSYSNDYYHDDDRIIEDDDFINDDELMNNDTSIIVEFDDNNNNNKKKKNVFFEKYCQIPNYDEWKDPTPEWKRRTPYFLLIGAKKAGTTALHDWLRHHPRIVSGVIKELLYFLPRQFERYSPNDKVQIDRVRNDLYDYGFDTSSISQSESDLLAFEATPGYLFYSTYSRIPILCAFPWINLLMTLRNPIDRTYSGYNFLLDAQVRMRKRKQIKALKMNKRYNNGTNTTTWNSRNNILGTMAKQNRNNTIYLMLKKHLVTLEDCIEYDMSLLEKAGVIRNNKKKDLLFAGSIEERQAWTKYQGMTGEINCDRPIGRSLYILQLQEWYDGLREIGRDPTKDIFVVRNEDMKTTPDVVYDRIIQWLDLPSHQLPQFSHKMVTTYRTLPMNNQTRHMLQHFYEPYNQRLYQLLGWDTTTNSTTNLW